VNAPIFNTRQLIERLKDENELLVIDDPVDPNLELAEIHRQIVSWHGPALLFTNVLGTSFPVATNLYGSEKRINIAFSKEPEKLIKDAVNFIDHAFPPSLKNFWNARGLIGKSLKIGTKKVHSPDLWQNQIPGANLKLLPQIKCWPEDGGAFVTLPLVYTESPVSGKNNLGMYRIQLHREDRCGMHIQIHRGGGFHYHEAEKLNQSLPVHIYTGGPPALTLSAILPLPEDIPEIIFASLILGEKIHKAKRQDLSPLPFLSQSDFCITGNIPPHVRMPEGPFGDHYGYYALKHDYPFVNVNHIFHRKDAIYPATVVGRPPQEDHYIACYLQDLLKPLIKLTMPQVHEVWAYEESGVHSLAGAVVQNRYPREALTTALRILGEGQLSLSKVLLVTDQMIDVKNIYKFLQTILERIDLSKDVFIISQSSQDTLDYTGPKVNEGSKMILLGLGKAKRQLPQEFFGTLANSDFTDPHVFCPGALVITGPRYDEDPKACERLSQEKSLTPWQVVFLVDDATAATRTPEDFLWHIFTRFEPAGDVYARDVNYERYHPHFSAPLVIDCRLKPWYPKVLEPLPDVEAKARKLLRKYGYGE
jgi:UbiD family decarboxylase